MDIPRKRKATLAGAFAALAACHLITALFFAASCLRHHSSGVFAEFELAREIKKKKKRPHYACVCAAVSLQALCGAVIAFGVSSQRSNVPGLHLGLAPH